MAAEQLKRAERDAVILQEEQTRAYKDGVLVRQWLEANVEKCEDSVAFVRRSRLYASYKAEHSEESHTRTAVGKARFFQILLEVLGEATFKARHRDNTGQYKDIFLGWIQESRL